MVWTFKTKIVSVLWAFALGLSLYLLELNSESISKVERKLVNRSRPLFQWNLSIFWIFNWTSLTFFILRFPRHGNVTKFQNSPFLAISKTSSSCKCSQHLLWVVGRQVFEFSHRSFLDGFVELLSISTYNWLIQRLKIRALSNSRCANATKNFPTGEQQSRYNFFVQLKTFPIIMWFVTYLHLNILNSYKSDHIKNTCKFFFLHSALQCLQVIYLQDDRLTEFD